MFSCVYRNVVCGRLQIFRCLSRKSHLVTTSAMNPAGPCGFNTLLSPQPCQSSCLSVLKRDFSLLKRTETMLIAKTPVIQSNVGYKARGKMRKRCASCYFVMRKGQRFVECKEHPRHKQMQKLPKRKQWRED